MNTSRGNHFDYIISGAGASGLSLLVRLILSGAIRNKRVLLLDKAPKTSNDRTWCFWEKEKGFFEAVVYRSWQDLSFHAHTFSKEFTISPYRYKMIRGIDFYNHCLHIISGQSNITLRYGTVTELNSAADKAWLMLDEEKISADFIFNSIILSNEYLQKDPHYLLQHFKGWNIETAAPVFDPLRATLMDFRVEQPRGAAFVYIMPFTGTTALVEYTQFSKELLTHDAYNNALKEYINNFVTKGDYKIVAEEFGIIPMTGQAFTPKNGRIINIGTIGGQTKASTGYTFQFIQRYTNDLVPLFAGNRFNDIPGQGRKYRFYDKVLLNVLSTGKRSGEEIFTRLFKANHPAAILDFLDNNSTLFQELSLIRTLPSWPFLRAAFEQF